MLAVAQFPFASPGAAGSTERVECAGLAELSLSGDTKTIRPPAGQRAQLRHPRPAAAGDFDPDYAFRGLCCRPLLQAESPAADKRMRRLRRCTQPV